MMEYKNLGRTGVMVSPIGLCTMHLNGDTNYSESGKIMHAAFTTGISF